MALNSSLIWTWESFVCVLFDDAVITWSDADFDDVSSSQNQLLYHLSCHYISRLRKNMFYWLLREKRSTCKHDIDTASTDHDSVGGELLPDIFDKVNKVFRVAIGHVYTNILQLRHRRQDGWDPVKVSFASPCADCYTLRGKKKSTDRVKLQCVQLLIKTNKVPKSRST